MSHIQGSQTSGQARDPSTREARLEEHRESEASLKKSTVFDSPYQKIKNTFKYESQRLGCGEDSWTLSCV